MKEQKQMPLTILLADDDTDDLYFFEKALMELSIPTKLLTVGDGEQLMNYLLENSEQLPNALFLDLNMPRKNGSECLAEIKSNEKLKDLPIVMYSTSLNESIADVLYEKGAHFYMQKSNFSELIKCVEAVLIFLEKGKLKQPSREHFIICAPKVKSQINVRT